MAERAQRPSDRAVFVISVAAELAGVHPREIQELTRKGVNLAGVRRVIELRQEIDLLAARAAELDAELERLTRRHRQELDEVQRAARRDLVLPWSSAAIVRYQPRPPDEVT